MALTNSLQLEIRIATKKALEYVGIGLPMREVDLQFILKPTSSRVNKPITSLSKINDELTNTGDASLALFTKIHKDLERVNRYNLATNARLDLAKFYLNKSYVKLIQVMKSYQDNGKVPDDQMRADIIDAGLKVVEQLILAFKMSFAKMYDLPNWRYGSKRNNVNLCATRLFELISLEQKLGALRFKCLPASSWQCVNKIFHVMSEYENITYLIPTIGTNLLKTQGITYSSTLKHLFLEIQIHGYFDLLTFPTSAMPIAESYLKSQFDSLILQKVGAEGVILGNDHLFIGHNQSSPPRLISAAPMEDIPGASISLQQLKLDLKHSFDDVMNSAEQNNVFLLKSSFFRKLSAKDRLALSTQLYYCMMTPPAYMTQYDSPKALKLLIYTGFKDCFGVLIQSSDPELYKSSLKDELAARSAAIGEDETAEVESLWYCLLNNNQQLVLQSQETKYTVSLAVGMLMAYDFQATNEKKTEFGIVSRLERNTNRQIIIHMRKLSSRAEAVSFTEIVSEESTDKAGAVAGEQQSKVQSPKEQSPKEQSPKEQSPKEQPKNLPGLITVVSNSWQLLVPNNIAYRKDKEIIINRGKQKLPAKLGKLSIATQRFSIYQLYGKEIENLNPVNPNQEKNAPQQQGSNNVLF